MSEYTCRHCGAKFDTLYLGLTKHIQETHPAKYNFDADIRPYFEEAVMEEHRHIKPQISPAEKRARRRFLWVIVTASVLITLFATYAVMILAGDVPILAGITAAVWVALIMLSGFIIKGLAE